MENFPEPLFIFSLPRSGSTLLQRVLATSEYIATTSEPWILLPLIYMTRSRGIYAEYDQRAASMGVENLCGELPNGYKDLDCEIRHFVLRLYSRVTQENQRYFLDKSPAYSLIVDKVMEMFPEGKFLFLWRNPLAVMASLMESFGEGKWNLYRHKAELFKGLENLVRTYELSESKVHPVCYEDLIVKPEKTLAGIQRYLELPFDSSGLSEFSEVEFTGGLGDSMGARKYSSIDQEPLEKWKETFSNPIRRAQGQRYLDWIGSTRLAIMGYEKAELLAELKSISMSSHYMVSDLARNVFGLFFPLIEPTMLKRKVLTKKDWKDIYAHR